jgi:hypothetical protein
MHESSFWRRWVDPAARTAPAGAPGLPRRTRTENAWASRPRTTRRMRASRVNVASHVASGDPAVTEVPRPTDSRAGQPYVFRGQPAQQLRSAMVMLVADNPPSGRRCDIE